VEEDVGQRARSEGELTRSFVGLGRDGRLAVLAGSHTGFAFLEVAG